MMRSERRASPLLALIAFEVAAIAGLSWVGSNSAMQVPWGDLSGWVQTSTVDELAMPILRYAALGLAWWMLISTLLFVLAQLTRVPIAIRFAGAFTLPAVRRAVDGAMAVSIATTSVVGFAAGAVNIESIVTANGASATQLIANLGQSDQGAVGTPGPGAANSTSSTTAGSQNPESLVTTSTEAPATTSSTAAPTTTSTTQNPVTTTSGADGNSSNQTTNEQATTSLAPSAGNDFVPTPRPGAVTATTTPQGPSTPSNAPAPEAPAQAPAPSKSGTHTVVPGDNLWTISRDAIADHRGVDKKSISEVDIRTYWLKVIDLNKDSIRSHDPHWIFPGEIIQLPSLGNSSTATGS